MDTFFTTLKKLMVATVFLIFGFVATYVPQAWNEVRTVHAGGGVGNALEVTQLANLGQLEGINISSSLSAAHNAVTSAATQSLVVKEYTLDGLAWSIAKGVVSSMVQVLVNWINSGFDGSPQFVTDLEGFLLNAADEAIGGYLDEIGGIGSFVCSPFRLDIQVSIALQYAQSRTGQPAPTCTLTGIIDNIEGFLSGAQGSFGEGGWNDWFDITSSPEIYTPYGALLAAESGARARIINAQGKELIQLDWGDGFLSGEICNFVQGPSGDEEECFISKPGKIIEEALSFNLDSGRQSLITADEIDEVIGALISQLANAALSGAAGLLGLSAGTGYTDAGFDAGSYVNQAAADDSFLPGNSTVLLGLLNDSLSTQIAYNNLADLYRPRLVAYSNDGSKTAGERATAAAAAADALEVINNTNADILTLTQIIADLNDPNITPEQQNLALNQYYSLTLYTSAQMDTSEALWNNALQ